jgi:methionine-rich copper-binding protein CopC
MEIENAMKVQNMELEFNYNMQLEQVRANVKNQKEKEIEDRKDERTRIQATQQSQLIDQRKNDLLPTDFEENQQPPLLGEI